MAEDGLVICYHGYEGQGPEHSSARLGATCSSCAEDNILPPAVRPPGPTTFTTSCAASTVRETTQSR